MPNITLINNLLNRFRSTWGTTVIFADTNYSVTTTEVPPVRAGLGFEGTANMQPFEVASDPRLFNFCPSDFGDNPFPKFLDNIDYHSNTYTITRTEIEDIANIHTAFRAYAYRVPLGTDNSVFLTESYSLWTPKTMLAQLDMTTLNVYDAGYTNSGTIKAFFNPLSHQEKLIAYGTADYRANAAYVSVDVPLGSILRNQSTGEGWIATTPSESYAATGLRIVTVRHMPVLPLEVNS